MESVLSWRELYDRTPPEDISAEHLETSLPNGIIPSHPSGATGAHLTHPRQGFPQPLHARSRSMGSRHPNRERHLPALSGPPLTPFFSPDAARFVRSPETPSFETRAAVPSAAPPSSFSPFHTFAFENHYTRIPGGTKLRRRSSTVSWDFFDPVGVEALRQSIQLDQVQVHTPDAPSTSTTPPYEEKRILGSLKTERPPGVWKRYSSALPRQSSSASVHQVTPSLTSAAHKAGKEKGSSSSRQASGTASPARSTPSRRSARFSYPSRHSTVNFSRPLPITQVPQQLKSRFSSYSEAASESTDNLIAGNETSALSTEAEARLAADGPRASEIEQLHNVPLVEGPAVVTDNPEEESDFARILRDTIRQREEANAPLRTLGVLFKDLRVSVKESLDSSYQHTLGSLMHDYLTPWGVYNRILQSKQATNKDLLRGFEGVVKPGEMLLVLGLPGSGCSTFLKTLANQTQEYSYVGGIRQYGSLTPEEIRKTFRGDVVYCPEDDVHFPTLTVSQTLEFAAACRAPHARAQGQTRKQFVQTASDVLTTIFGLRHVRQTPVGDASLRGVSGGEKKRVSISEALALQSKLTCWDNSTRGLDSSTALEYCKALRIATDLARLTTVVCLYQAGDSLVELFDKVCVIGNGRMWYFGPVGDSVEYFASLGYKKSERVGVADFLVQVTDPISRVQSENHPFPPPQTAEEFARSFLASPYAIRNREEMMAFWHEFAGREEVKTAYKISAAADRQPFASFLPSKKKPRSPAELESETLKGNFTIGIALQTVETLKRRARILRGSWTIVAVQAFAFTYQALILGSVFIRLPNATSSFFSRGGTLFFGLMFGALSALAEIPALYGQRPIINRHQRAAMYHPFIDTFAYTLVDIPPTIVILLSFCIVIYFMVGLQQTARQFFTFYFLVVLLTFVMKACFRSIAGFFRSQHTAAAVAGLLTLILIQYTGYVIPNRDIIGALRWITYVNPLRYGFEAVIANEYSTINAVCSSLVPSGPAYANVSLSNQVCTQIGAVPGKATVSGTEFIALAYGFSESNLGRNVGILFAYFTFFTICLVLFTEFNSGSAVETSKVLYKRGSLGQVTTTTTIPVTKFGNDKQQHDYPPSPESSKFVHPSPTDTKSTKTFSWKHLEYVVPVTGGERKLLDKVSGFVAPGKLTALMGESGAGKTTLLNVLAGRVNTGVVNGDILVNGQPLPSDFKSQTGYCQQLDTHVAEQTVYEALLFSAKLRQPQSVSIAEKEAHVRNCLRLCGLESHADAMVGTLGVEHRKRTTIGVELAAKPQLLLFLDEPTSGLDSQSAMSIMLFLRDLANNGQAILCTIHQPSSQLFQMFDRLLLLQKGGRTVYFGDMGEDSRTLIGYFERNGSRRCNPSENPAEWMLEVIGAGATATSTIDWHQKWQNSMEAENLSKEIEELHNNHQPQATVKIAKLSDFATSWSYQFLTLYERTASSFWRNPSYLLAKMFLNITSGLLIGFTFYQVDNSIQGTQNKLFAIFMSSVPSTTMVNQMLEPWITARTIFEVRERPSQMYSWTAFITSRLLVEIPWNILATTLFFICWYWTVGYSTDRAGYSYLMFAVVFPLYYTTIGSAIASISPNPLVGGQIFSLLFTFVFIFDGVLQPYDQLGWWKWMYRVSPFTYYIEGVLGQVAGRQKITCDPLEYSVLQPPTGMSCSEYMGPFIQAVGGYLLDPTANSSCAYCAGDTTDRYLSQTHNIYYDHHWRDLGFLGIYIIFNICALFLGMYMFRIRKK